MGMGGGEEGKWRGEERERRRGWKGRGGKGLRKGKGIGRGRGKERGISE